MNQLQFLFFRLIFNPKSWQALLKQFMSCWRSSAEWAAMAASLVKRKSHMHFSWILVFALNLERLKSFPSDLVQIKTPSVTVPKACFSMTAKKIPNRVGTRIQPCFAPLQMSKGSDVEPSKTTVPFISS